MALSNLYGVDLTKAGERFGLSAADLEELFSMADTPKEHGGDDFDASASRTFEGLPQTKVQWTEKGRGGAMGFRGPDRPTLTRTFGSEAVGAQTLSSRPGDDGPQVPEPAQTPQTLRSFIGPQGDPTGGAIGLSGIQRAMAAGMTPSQIQQQARTEGLAFGAQAGSALGLGDLRSSIGALGDPTGGALGLSAVERARQSGLSDTAIRQLAQQQNLTFGTAAAQSLGMPAPAAPAPAPRPASAPSPAPMTQFVGAQGTAGGGFGLEAVNRARAAGLSDAQIRQQVAAQGLTLGPAAAASLR